MMANILIRLVLAGVMFFACTSDTVRAQHKSDFPNLPFRLEMKRLDEAALELKNDPEAVVDLVAFSAKLTDRRLALKRLAKSRSYLIKSHKIASSRITTVYAGCREGLIMQIFVGRRSEDGSARAGFISTEEVIRLTCLKKE